MNKIKRTVVLFCLTTAAIAQGQSTPILTFDPSQRSTDTPTWQVPRSGQLDSTNQKALGDSRVLADPANQALLTPIKTPSGTLQFFSPVARILTSVTDDLSPLEEDPLEACYNLQKLDLSLIRVRFQGCRNVDRKLIDETFMHSLIACRDVYNSEQYAPGAQKRGYVNLSSQSSLLGLMEVMAVTFKELPLPKTMWTARDREQFREIFVKVRGVTLVKNIGKQLQLFTSFVSAANRCNMGQVATELVAPLRADYDQALTRIQEIDRKGRAQVLADRNAVIQKGRSREAFPNSNLSDEDIRFLTIWLGGFAWRNRGGGPIKERGTQNARLYHALLPLRTLAYMAGAYGTADSIGAKQFFRLSRHGWGKSMDMGLNSNTIEEDTIGMANRGLLQVTDIAKELDQKGFDGSLVRLGGAQMGTCYNFAAERLWLIQVHPHPPKPFEGFLEGFTAWGELCTGMTIALGTTEALLKGRAASGYQNQQGFMDQNGQQFQAVQTVQPTQVVQPVQQTPATTSAPQVQTFSRTFRIPSIPKIPKIPSFRR